MSTRSKPALAAATVERKVHFKLYKSGKLWLVMGLAIGIWAAKPQAALAAETDSPPSALVTDSVADEETAAEADAAVDPAITDEEVANSDVAPIPNETDAIADGETAATTIDDATPITTDAVIDNVTDDAPAVSDAAADTISEATTAIDPDVTQTSSPPAANESLPAPNETSDTAVTDATSADTATTPVSGEVTAPPTNTVLPNSSTTGATTDDATDSADPDTAAISNAITAPLAVNSFAASPMAALAPTAIMAVVPPTTIANGVLSAVNSAPVDIKSYALANPGIMTSFYENYKKNPSGVYVALEPVANVTVPPGFSDAIFNNPALPSNYTLTATNTRTLNGNIELTPASVITLSVPTQTMYAPSGLYYTEYIQYWSINALWGDTAGLTKQLSPDINTNAAKINGFTETLSFSGNNQAYWLIWQTDYTNIPGSKAWMLGERVLMGTISSQLHQLKPTLNPVTAGATTLSGTGTAVGDTITLYNGTTVAETATVAADGVWTMNIAGKASTAVGAKQNLVIVESNAIGDTPGAVVVPQFENATRNVPLIDATTNANLGTDTQTVVLSRTGTIALNGTQPGTINWGAYSTGTWGGYTHATYPTIANYVPTWASYSGATATVGTTTGAPVLYYPATLTVSPKATSDNFTTDIVAPKNYGDLVVTNQPNGTKYPGGLTQASLTGTTTRTIHLIDENGASLGDKVQTIDWYRTATVTFTSASPTGAATYSPTWSSDMSTSFPIFPAPAIAGMVPSVASVPLARSFNPTFTIEATIQYFPSTVTVNPGDNVPIDGPVSADPDDPRKYPATVAESFLNKTITRTIQPVDSSGKAIADPVLQTVTYTRSATIDYSTATPTVTYGNWSSDDRIWPRQNAPAVPGMITATNFIQPVTTSGDTEDLTVTILYFPDTVTVTIDDPKHAGEYATDLTNDPRQIPYDLTEAELGQTITRTLHFVDGTTGATLLPDVAQAVDYTRTATVTYTKVDDTIVGDVSYSKFESADPYWSIATAPTIAGKVSLTPAAAYTRVPAGASDENYTFYYYPVSKLVTADDPKAEDEPVNPNDPHDTRVYPAGVDEEDLSYVVVRTINYVDENGTPVARSHQDAADFTREATVYFDGRPTVYSVWDSEPTSLPAVDNPVVAGMITKETTVPETPVDKNSAHQIAIDVVYFPAIVTIAPDDPHNEGDAVSDHPDDPRQYPAGVSENDLNHAVTRTISLIDQATGEKLGEDMVQTVTYTRNGQIDYSTGEPVLTLNDWTTADPRWQVLPAPNFDGYVAAPTEIAAVTTTRDTPDDAQTIDYFQALVTVEPTDPKAPGTPVSDVEDDPRAYPAGVDEAELTKTITRKIEFVDAESGDVVAASITQEATFTRNAQVDFAKDPNTPIYSDWTLSEGGWPAIDVPTIPDYVTDRANIDAVDSITVDTGDDAVMVKYYPSVVDVKATAPKGEGDPVSDDPDDPRQYPAGVDVDALNRTISRTISYRNGETGESYDEDVTQTVTWSKDAKVDFATGTVSYGAEYSANDEWPAVTSPEKSDMMLGTDQAVVPAVTTVETTTDATVIVNYYPRFGTVSADDPQAAGDKPTTQPDDPRVYPAGVDTQALNRTILRTINFINAETKAPVATPVVQEATFTRDAKVDFLTGIVTPDPWTPATATWPQAASPTVAGLIADLDTTASADVTAASIATAVTVYYYPADGTVLATDPKQAGDPVSDDPNDPRVYPDGVAESDLNKTITRLIEYRDGLSGDLLDSETQSVSFARDAKVDFVTNTPTYLNWRPENAILPGLDAPARPNMIATPASIAALPTTVDSAPDPVVIYYFPSSVHVTADEPQTADTPVTSVAEDPRLWPAGLTPTDLQRQVERVISFVDANDQPLLESKVQTVTFTRGANVDWSTGTGTVVYDKWTAAEPDWPAGDSPAIDGYFAVLASFDSATPTVDDPTAHLTIRYFETTVTVTADAPHDAGEPVASHPDDPREYPSGVTTADLNKTVTRTINYLDADGNILDTQTQPLTFTRDAHVDYSEGPTQGTVTYTAWSPENAQWEAVNTPEREGYFPTIATVPAENTTGDTADAVVNVSYYASAFTVEPDEPKAPGEKASDDPSDPRIFPAGVTADDLNRTVTRTISYLNTDGEVVAETVVQPVVYTRKAFVVFATDGTGSVSGYSDWTSINPDWQAVTSPTLDDLMANQPIVEAAPSDPAVPDTPITVRYYPRTETVTADQTVTAGDPVIPTDPEDGRAWPETITKDDLNRVITRTITYIDENGAAIGDPVIQRVTYTRDATVDFIDNSVVYSDWTTKDALWAEQASPEQDDLIPSRAVVPAFTTTTTGDTEETITYYPSIVTVQPDSPKDPGIEIYPTTDGDDPIVYPEGVSESELNRIITRTINYLNADSKDPVTEAKVQTTTYTRIATIDLKTNKVTYSNWATEDNLLPAVISPTITDLVANQAQIAELETTPETADQTETVLYYPSIGTVTPDQPKDPGDKVNPNDPDDNRVYPEGVAEADLNRTITRTIHYVDGKTGETLAPDAVQPVTFTRIASVDFISGKPNYTDWTTTDDQWSERISPVLDNYLATDQTIPAVTVLDDTDSLEVTVRYYASTGMVAPDAPKAAGDPVDPTDKDDPRTYPSGVAEADLNKLVTRTITYINAESGDSYGEDVVQTVKYTRNATVDFIAKTVTYGNWETTAPVWAEQITPEKDGLVPNQSLVAAVTTTDATPSETIIVRYYPSIVTVTPDQPKAPGDKVYPTDDETDVDFELVYPTGVAEADLNRTITRTINYLNAGTGDPVAAAEKQTVTFTRTASVDLKTGKVTYSNWATDDDILPAVTSPIVSELIANKTQVDALTTTAETTDQTETVLYYPKTLTVTPDQPKTPGDKVIPDDPNDNRVYPDGVTEAELNKTITRTIHYVDGKTGEQVAPDTVQSVTFTRIATVDFTTGKVNYTPWTSADDQWPETTNPPIEKLFTTADGFTAITVTPTTKNAEFTVDYYASTETISPDAPKTEGDRVDPTDENDPRTYPGGLTAEDLHKTVTRTITYINGETGEALADPVVQPVTYTRNAIVNFTDGSVVYGKWFTTDAVWPAQTSPEQAGLLPNPTSVSAVTTTDATADDTVVVRYYPSRQTIKPDQPKAPGTAVNVDDPNDNRKYPEGVEATDLNKTITRTILYVDENGAAIGEPVIQQVTYTRTATVDFATGDVTYSDWTSDDSTWPQASGQPIDGLLTPKPIPAIATTADTEDVTVKVVYFTDHVTVTPDHPQNAGDKVTQVPDDDRIYPAGVSDADLNKTITRTINLIGPNGEVLLPPVIQTVTFTRIATVTFDADGNTTVTYGDWTPDDASFAAFTPPTINGYNPNLTLIPSLAVDANSTPTSVSVTYTAVQADTPTPAPKGDDTPPSTNQNNQGGTGTSIEVAPATSSQAPNPTPAPTPPPANTTLPQMNDETTPTLGLIGLVLAALMSGLSLIGIRRRHDQ